MINDNPRVDYYEKLSDSLDKKIADFNLKALAFIGGILLKPLATATEPFFRRNMGERYFTAGIAGLGLVFWLMVQELSALCMGLVTRNRSQLPENMHDFLVHFCVTFVLSFAYMFMAVWNLVAATNRQKQGVVWHSLSRGQSIFGSENTIRDVAIAVLITLVLFHFEPVIGIFFAASRCVSYYTAAQERASIYARYLDAMDAQIEAQYLERALRDGEPPRLTEGLYGPLPKRFKGEHRAHVARVVAGGSSAVATPDTTQRNPKASGRPASVLSKVAEPAAATTSQVAPTKPILRGSVLGTKRFRRLVLFGMLFAGTVAVGVAIYPAIRVKIHQPTHADVPKSAAEQATAVTPIKRLPWAMAPQRVTDIESADRKANSAPSDIAVFEEQKRQLMEKLDAASGLANRLQREKSLEQLKTTIATQELQLSRFKAACEPRFATNTTLIADLASSARGSLTENNNKAREIVAYTLQQEEESLSQFEQTLPTLALEPQTDLSKLSVPLKTFITKIESEHQQITAVLAELDSAIAKAPKKKGFLFIK